MSFRPYIPGPSPFAKIPLRWASPPGPDVVPAEPEGPRVISQNTFAANVNTGTINTSFSVGNRVATQSFTSPVGVVAVSLSTSVVNATSDGIIAVWVSKDTGPTQSLSGSTDIMVDHLINQGLSHSMRSGISFTDDVAPKYSSNEQMAIYICAFGTGFANNRIVVSATIRFFPLL